MTVGTAPADVRVVLPEEDGGNGDAVRAAVTTVLDALVSQLALPIASPSVTVTVGDRAELVVNEESCALPDPRYLLRHSGSVEHRFAQALHTQAWTLVTPAVADSLWQALGDGDARADGAPPWFRRVTQALVEHDVRPTRLGPLLAIDPDAGPARLFESALAAAAHPVRILVDEQTSQAWTDDRRELLSFLATGIGDELGLPMAVPRLETDFGLPDYHFAIEVGDVATLPLPGIRPDQIMVNDTQDRLALLGWPELQAAPVTNPATGQPASLTAATFTDRLQEIGMTVWSMNGYIVLTAAETVRRRAHHLYHAELLAYQVDRLTPDHPVLRPMVEALGGVELITRVLRRLLREEIPINGLPVLLPQLYGLTEPAPSDPARVMFDLGRHRVDVVAAPEIGDADEASLAEAARAALSRRIRHKYTRGTNTLVVYLLDHEVESRLQDPAALTAEERAALLDMISTELAFLPPTAQTPVILTRAPIRARLRSVIKHAFPRLSVVAYDELPSALNVQPIARLSLGP